MTEFLNLGELNGPETPKSLREACGGGGGGGAQEGEEGKGGCNFCHV